jgi:hypothetical protein
LANCSSLAVAVKKLLTRFLVSLTLISCIWEANAGQFKPASVLPDQPLFTGFTNTPCVSELQLSAVTKRLFSSTLIESFNSRNRYDLLGRIDSISDSTAEDVKIFASLYGKCLRTMEQERPHQLKLIEFAVDVDVLFARLINKTLSVGEFNQAILRLHSRYLSSQNLNDLSNTTNSASATKDRSASESVLTGTTRENSDATKHIDRNLDLQPSPLTAIAVERRATNDISSNGIAQRVESNAPPTLEAEITKGPAGKSSEGGELDRRSNTLGETNSKPKLRNSRSASSNDVVKKQACKTCKPKKPAANPKNPKAPNKQNKANDQRQPLKNQQRAEMPGI